VDKSAAPTSFSQPNQGLVDAVPFQPWMQPIGGERPFTLPADQGLAPEPYRYENRVPQEGPEVSPPTQGLASLVQPSPNINSQIAKDNSARLSNAPSPFGMSFDQIAGDGLDTLTGADLGISAPATQAPATQAPAPSPSVAPSTPTPYGYWQSGGSGFGGEGGGQTSPDVWIPTADYTKSYTNVAGYKPYEGTLDPKAFSWVRPAQSGADIYGIWNFDTSAARQAASEQALEATKGMVGVHPETGESTGAGTANVPEPFYSNDEKGNPVLDSGYGLKDVSGLVHGSTQVRVDKDHNKIVSAFFDPKTGKLVGNPVEQVYKIQQSSPWENALFSLAMGAIMGPLAGAFGGGALGAGLAGAAMGGAGASVGGGDVLKGALTGGLGAGLGSLASGYINPAASAAGQAVGGGTLGDIVSGATKGALTSGTGALVSGKSIGDALLSGALGGGVSSGVNALAGDTGLPSAVVNPLASAATAAILGKDPTMAAFNSLLGQITKAAGQSNAGAMTSGEEEERKGANDVYELLKQFPDNQATANAVNTLLKGQTTTVGSGDDLTGGVSNEDLDKLLGTGLTGAGSTSGVGTSAGDEQTGGTLLDQLTAAGVDTGTAGTSTGYTGEGTGLTGTGEDTSVGGEDTGEGGEGGDVNKSTLSEQAKFLESNVEDQDTINQLLKDYAVDSDQLLGGIGNLPEDFMVTDKGTIKSTYSGEEGYFDSNGNFVTYDVRPPYTSGGTGGTGGGAPTKTTKPTTPTKPTTAQSTFDPALLFALSSMLSQKPETPRERENAARIAAKSAFGGLPYQDIVDAYSQIYGE
jgi:hypothetical protein